VTITPDHQPAAPERDPARITGRSVLLGLTTAAVVAFVGNYWEMVLLTGSLVKSNFPVALVLWFCVWLAINSVIARVRPAWMFTSTEMMVVFATAWVAGMMPGVGWMGYLVGALPAPHFFASPENRWQELFFDALPGWAFPIPTRQTVDGFYFGLPPGAPVPWSAWTMPLWWWFSGALALMGAGYFTICVFHRQWADAERLTYPLVQFPVDMMEGFDEGKALPTILRKPLFWGGFAWTAGIIFWNIITYWYPNVPRITLFDERWSKTIHFARGFPPFFYRVLPPVIGLSYLCSLDLLFSFWFFSILSIVKIGTIARTGLTIGLAGQPSQGSEIVNLESHGAMTVLVIWSIWIARRHLRKVWEECRTGVRGDGPIAYRTAVLGLSVCALYAFAFLIRLGMSPALAAGQLTLMFIGYFASVKYIAASGFGYLFPVWSKGGSFLRIVTGTARMGTRDLVALRLADTSMLFGGTRIQTLQTLAHHLKLMDHVRSGRGLGHAALVVAFAAGFFVSAATIIYFCYQESALLLRSWTVWEGPLGIFGGMASSLAESERTVFDPQKMGIWLLGGAEAAALAVIRSRVTWWPLHPLGLAFQNTIGLQYYALSIFMTWTAKLLIIRLGGQRAYENAKPFFYGTVVGYCVGIGVGMIVDLIWFTGAGHELHDF
jgi:hypothetical protein